MGDVRRDVIRSAVGPRRGREVTAPVMVYPAPPPAPDGSRTAARRAPPPATPTRSSATWRPTPNPPGCGRGCCASHPGLCHRADPGDPAYQHPGHQLRAGRRPGGGQPGRAAGRHLDPGGALGAAPGALRVGQPARGPGPGATGRLRVGRGAGLPGHAVAGSAGPTPTATATEASTPRWRSRPRPPPACTWSPPRAAAPGTCCRSTSSRRVPDRGAGGRSGYRCRSCAQVSGRGRGGWRCARCSSGWAGWAAPGRHGRTRPG